MFFTPQICFSFTVRLMPFASSCQLSLCITANAFTADDTRWEGVQYIFLRTWTQRRASKYSEEKKWAAEVNSLT